MGCLSQSSRGAGKRSSVWSKEKTDFLIKLHEQFKIHKFPNMEISRRLPGNTKQISNKRRILLAHRTRVMTEAVETSSENEEESVVFEGRETYPETTKNEEWKEQFREAITANQFQEDSTLKKVQKEILRLASQDSVTEDEINALV
jgi:hypothetical protein